MITVNAIGDACPLPVVKTIQAIRDLQGAGSVETLVDNQTAVENLKRLAESKGYGFTVEQQGKTEYRVVMQIGQDAPGPEYAPVCCPTQTSKRTVVAISSDCMGSGDDTLGRMLLKGFVFALRQMEEPPQTILFYNGGARISCEGSESLEDLQELAARGVEILTCGTCLNFYGLTEKLRVGGVTNMYSIVETLCSADTVIKP